MRVASPRTMSEGIEDAIKLALTKNGAMTKTQLMQEPAVLDRLSVLAGISRKPLPVVLKHALQNARAAKHIECVDMKWRITQ